MKECKNCKRHGTLDCLQSIMCFSAENKPFYEEIEQKQHKRRFSANIKATIIAIVVVFVLLVSYLQREQRNTEFTELKKEVELLKEKVYEPNN